MRERYFDNEFDALRAAVRLRYEIDRMAVGRSDDPTDAFVLK
jgi:hypothetical protein